MLTIFGKMSEAVFPQVKAVMLEIGKVYLSAEKIMDDDGNETVHFDYAFVIQEPIIGGTKLVKQVRFLIQSRTKRFSDIPGIAFCGPVVVGPTDEDSIPEENVDTGLSTIERIRRRNVDLMDENK